jgi:benzodiazapine receptor
LPLFVAQLALIALWTFLFFGLQRPDFASVELVVFWLAILGVLILFWRIDRRAGALLIPYLAWVCFAACLNFVLWRMNLGAIG